MDGKRNNYYNGKHILVSRSLIFIVAFLLFFVGLNSFRVQNNLQEIFFNQFPFTAILASCMALTMMVNGIDLSIGGNISFSSYVCVSIVIKTGNVAQGIVVALFIGLAIGVINGILIALVGLPPYIATYCMEMIIFGAANAYSRGLQLSGFDELRYVFITFRELYLFISIILIGIMWLVLSKTLFGLKVLYVGQGFRAAELSGIKTNVVIIIMYALSGIFAAVIGIMYVTNFGAAQANLGYDFVLQGIAAAFIGGASIIRFRGTLLNAVIGSLILVVLCNGLLKVGVAGVWKELIYSIVIVISILLDCVARKKKVRYVRHA